MEGGIWIGTGGRVVPGYLGRPEWKKAFGGYRGEWGYNVIWEDPSGRRHLEELGIDMMKLLKLIFNK